MVSLEYICFTIVILFIAVEDCKTRNIKDEKVIYLFVFGVLQVLNCSSFSYISDKVLGIVFPSLIIFFVSLLSNGKIGGGDIKLVSAVGFFQGANMATKILVIAISMLFVCSFIAIVSNIIKKRKFSDIPLGPFIAAAFIICLI